MTEGICVSGGACGVCAAACAPAITTVSATTNPAKRGTITNLPGGSYLAASDSCQPVAGQAPCAAARADEVSAVHGELREIGVECGQIGRRQLDIECSEVLAQVADVTRAGD
jgi:hypothetical protein